MYHTLLPELYLKLLKELLLEWLEIISIIYLDSRLLIELFQTFVEFAIIRESHIVYN